MNLPAQLEEALAQLFERAFPTGDVNLDGIDAKEFQAALESALSEDGTLTDASEGCSCPLISGLSAE